MNRRRLLRLSSAAVTTGAVAGLSGCIDSASQALSASGKPATDRLVTGAPDVGVSWEKYENGGLRAQGGGKCAAGNGDAPSRKTITVEGLEPGDEVKTRFTLKPCGNDALLWMNGRLIENAENDVSGAEAEDPNEGDITDRGELLNGLKALAWYDDGDGSFEDPEQIIFSGSLGELLLILSFDEGAGDWGLPLDGNPPRTQFRNSNPLIQDPSQCGERGFDRRVQSGETVSVDADRDGQDERVTVRNNPRCTDFGLFRDALIDPQKGIPLPEPGGEPLVYSCSSVNGDHAVVMTSVDDDNNLDWAVDNSATPHELMTENHVVPDHHYSEGEVGFCVRRVIVHGKDVGANVYTYENGSSGDTNLSAPDNAEISRITVCHDFRGVVESSKTEHPKDYDRDAFSKGKPRQIGLRIHLPDHHTNEDIMQDDSVTFDLGFHAEETQ